MAGPTALAHVAIHDTVCQLITAGPRGLVLDVPAGEGALAERLIEEGFDVVCCDLYPQLFKLPGLAISQGDLDSRLPFEDAVFDIVICVEGLEHIENPANAIREFARISKPKSTLIVSVPNIMNIEERFKWLISGYTSHFKPLSDQALRAIPHDYRGMSEVALHVNPISYSEIRYLLEKYGFTIEGVFRDKKKNNSWALIPFAWLFRLIARFQSVEKRRERWQDELNSDEVLLGGNTLIFKAKKV